ncbi:unnamed protein product [Phytomonas sp. EM1]|nr:unnamed protein product [Phytomonas sp. EM1]|eukprot:CCW62342.1 unnamed protein product [Phytomonas sp. isolate EM1]
MCSNNCATAPVSLNLSAKECTKSPDDADLFIRTQTRSSLTHYYTHSPYAIGPLILSEKDVELTTLGSDSPSLNEDNPKPGSDASENRRRKKDASAGNNGPNHGGHATSPVNKKNICRHFIGGTCNRGCCCRFYHPGSIHRVVLPLCSRAPTQESITPLLDIALQQQRLNKRVSLSIPTLEAIPAAVMDGEGPTSCEFISHASLGSLDAGLSNTTHDDGGSVGRWRGLPIPDTPGEEEDDEERCADTPPERSSVFSPIRDGSSDRERLKGEGRGLMDSTPTASLMNGLFERPNGEAPPPPTGEAVQDRLGSRLRPFPFPTMSFGERLNARRGRRLNQDGVKRLWSKSNTPYRGKFSKYTELNLEYSCEQSAYPQLTCERNSGYLIPNNR